MTYIQRIRDVSIAPVWRRHTIPDLQLKYHSSSTIPMISMDYQNIVRGKKLGNTFGPKTDTQISSSFAASKIQNIMRYHARLARSRARMNTVSTRPPRRLIVSAQYNQRNIAMASAHSHSDIRPSRGECVYQTGERIDVPVLAPNYVPRKNRAVPENLVAQARRVGRTEPAVHETTGHTIQDGHDVYARSSEVRRAIDEIMAQQARRPPAGPTAFDPRLTPAWPGLKVF